MNGYEFIRQKQKQWALNKGIVIKECKNELGSFYTKSIEENLFMPLLPAITIAFSEGVNYKENLIPESVRKMQ